MTFRSLFSDLWVGPRGVGPRGVGPRGVGPRGVGPRGVGPRGVGPRGVGPRGWGIKNNKVLLFPYKQGSKMSFEVPLESPLDERKLV